LNPRKLREIAIARNWAQTGDHLCHFASLGN
jgi:hypothetical protein